MNPIRNLSLLFSAAIIFSCAERESIKRLDIITVNLADSLHIIPITDTLVQPIVYHNIPSTSNLLVDSTKNQFIATILPGILISKFKLQQELELIQQLAIKEKWTPEDSSVYDKQASRFKAATIQGLMLRMKTHPTSIVIAQAAVESGWGSSRFFTEANNLFGIWSYRSDEPRIEASYSRGDDSIFLRKYEDVSASITDYFETIARSRAYRSFRAARSQTENVSELLPHLKSYSERRMEYVDQLMNIISQNGFTEYDRYIIDPKFIIEEYSK